MNPVITIPEADLVAILGRNGEHWVKQSWGDGVSACLHGAIRRCQPVPGDAHLIQQVASRQGWGTGWNDASSTSWPMVRARLAHIEITDADLADTFGPQWEQIVALVRRAAVLTPDEAKRLAAARDAARDAAWAAAWAAAWDAAWAAAAARAAARDAAWATGAAAGALAARDLIGQHGFTQAHYDLLTGPWRTAIGPVHPDDAEVAG
jgi:plasmid maintenance system antidote protein VapI